MYNTNRYFVLEGMDGSGKTTQINAVKAAYDKINRSGNRPELVITKEPGGTEWGQKLRKLMLNDGSENEIAIALAMFSDRVENMRLVVKPALKEGKIVLSDRSWFSTLAYQGITPGYYSIIESVKQALGYMLIDPCKVFLLDVPVEVAMGYSKKADVFERSGTGFYRGVSERYLEIAETFGSDYFTILDGMDSEASITKKIINEICKSAFD